MEKASILHKIQHGFISDRPKLANPTFISYRNVQTPKIQHRLIPDHPETGEPVGIERRPAVAPYIFRRAKIFTPYGGTSSSP